MSRALRSDDAMHLLTTEVTVSSKLSKQHPVETATPGQKSAAAPKYVTVYTFVIWDHDRGSTAIYPRMATPETIARMRGKVNEETAWVVDESELDIEGFYNGPTR